MPTPLIESLRALAGADAVLDATELATRSAGVMRPDCLKAAALVRPMSTEELSVVDALVPRKQRGGGCARRPHRSGARW